MYVVLRMCLNLQNSSTRTIVFKPIKSKNFEAHGQVLSLLDSDYILKVAAEVQILNLFELQSPLDGLCRSSLIVQLYCSHHVIC